MADSKFWYLAFDGWRPVAGKLETKYKMGSCAAGPVDSEIEIAALFKTEQDARAAADADTLPVRLYAEPVAYVVIWVIVMQETGESSFYVQPCFGGDLRLDDRYVVGVFATEADAMAHAAALSAR